MNRRRIKITGIGPVSPTGIGRVEFWNGLLDGKSRGITIKRFREEAGHFVGAEVPDFSLDRYVSRIPSKRVPRHTQFAIAAAALAINDANISHNELRASRVAIYTGAALMDFGTINKSVEMILRRGPVNGLPSAITSASVGAIGAAVSDYLELTNTMNMAFQSACCSGLDAIGHAAMMLSRGEADIAICGGTEAPIYFHPMLELRMAGLAPGNPDKPDLQCRPFDLWRTTGMIGEGACMLVLEPENSSREHYAFIDGYASASDRVGALCSGLGSAMRSCISNAGLVVNDVESINAWGPGHREIDKHEAKMIEEVFRVRVEETPAYSIKGAIGNPLGAAGALQTAAAACGVCEGIVLPTVNWKYKDPDCALNLSDTVRFVSHRNSLINAHGISGANACLLISR